jgi:hypothetical protein
MKRIFLIAAIGTALLLLASGANLILTARANPLETARAMAAEQGRWTEDELVTLGGGYTGRFFGRTAHARYQPAGHADTEVYVEIEKPAPFLGWRLVTYRVDRAPR